MLLTPEGVAVLRGALAKVERRRLQDEAGREEFTQIEIDALSLWMALQIPVEGKMTRAERSERNRAQWLAGDRRKWGGRVKRRDPRRGWRNFSA